MLAHTCYVILTTTIIWLIKNFYLDLTKVLLKKATRLIHNRSPLDLRKNCHTGFELQNLGGLASDVGEQ
jgi:hypothetical protein